MIDAKLYEVSKYMSLTEHVTDFFVVSLNRPLWDGFSGEEKGSLTQAMKTASDWEWQAHPATTAAALKKLEGLMKVNPVSPEHRALFAAKTKPIYRQYAKSIGPDLLDLATKEITA